MSGPDPMQLALLGWGASKRRDLPWRRTHDPWAVLVSEVMLQQTQVTRVIPRFEEFLAAWPSPAACAAAPQAAVVRLWGGLGYPRRARALHRAARHVVELHGGQVPDDLDQLLALPGVGPYTARAVLAFAFEHDVGVVDTNVGRLLARLGGGRLAPAEAQRRADELVPEGRSWPWNQALFDLGAAVCTRAGPACGQCPVSTWCSWQGEGPDPAEGSAGTSQPQAPYEGSDRQGRGRLLARLRDQPVRLDAVAEVAGWPDDPDRARRVLTDLVIEGLVAIEHDAARLA